MRVLSFSEKICIIFVIRFLKSSAIISIISVIRVPYSDLMLIKGNSFTDSRGTLHFVNDFHFEGIKRFYTITHPDTSVIRAWQGHKIETKHFFVTKGKFLICWVEIDNWDNPGRDLKVNQQILDANNPQILVIPGGNANGFKALESDSQLIVFSDLTLEEAKDDNYRFENDYWIV